jgi:diadenosine tetraphosphatase ApaH/serine/threonine PP2A family protein phosphatase
LPAALFFFGHTHIQGGFLGPRGEAGPKVRVLPRVDRNETKLEGTLDPEHSYLINPGAVGQPRDRDPRAAYAFYDSVARTVTYERVEYNVARAQEKIVAAGLPQGLAARLAVGR